MHLIKTCNYHSTAQCTSTRVLCTLEACTSTACSRLACSTVPIQTRWIDIKALLQTRCPDLMGKMSTAMAVGTWYARVDKVALACADKWQVAITDWGMLLGASGRQTTQHMHTTHAHHPLHMDTLNTAKHTHMHTTHQRSYSPA